MSARFKKSSPSLIRRRLDREMLSQLAPKTKSAMAAGKLKATTSIQEQLIGLMM